MCILPKVNVPEPVEPTPTQAAKVPTRPWLLNQAANRVSPVGRLPSTARPATATAGSILGR